MALVNRALRVTRALLMDTHCSPTGVKLVPKAGPASLSRARGAHPALVLLPYDSTTMMASTAAVISSIFWLSDGLPAPMAFQIESKSLAP